MSELIDRQAAIEAVTKHNDINFGALPVGNRSYEDILHCVMIAYDEGIAHSIKALSALPTADSTALHDLLQDAIDAGIITETQASRLMDRIAEDNT